MTPSDAAEIVHAVDGLPLGIELAAAQLREVGADELARTLRGKTLSLGAGRSKSVGRTPTLRAALEESFARLSPTERDVLGQLSVFRGGFALEACQHVIALKSEGSTVARVLGRLSEASLVRIGEHPEFGRRWDLLESIREYAGEVLDTEGRTAVERRHVDYFLKAGEAHARQLKTRCGPEARSWLDVELDNLRSAARVARDARNRGAKDLDWSRQLARLSLVLSAALSKRLPRLAVDIVCAALEGCDGLEDRGPVTVPPELSTGLLVARATARLEIADYDDVEADARRVLATDAHTDSQLLLHAEARFLLGMAYVYRGEARHARTALVDALDSARGLHATHLEGRIRTALGWLFGESFRDATALDHHAKATLRMRAAGDGEAERWARTCWAVHRLFFESGDRGQELTDDVDGRTPGRNAEDAHRIWAKAIVAFDQGELDRSRSLALTARVTAERHGVRRLVAGTGFLLGPIADEQGRLHDAEMIYRELIESCRALRLRFEALAHLYLSGVLARRGCIEEARSSLKQAARLAATSGDERFAELTELQTAQIEIAEARAGAAAGDLVQVNRSLARAQQRIDLTQTHKNLAGQAVRPLARCSIEARHLLRIIGVELDRSLRNDAALHICRDGSWFRIGQGPTHTIPHGPVIRRCLAVLAEQRVASPGKPLDAFELLDRCWAGERMQAEAGSRRVRDVVMRLRRAGLEGVLLRSPHGGYLFDPTVFVEVS